jgi:hypothetical protein
MLRSLGMRNRWYRVCPKLGLQVLPGTLSVKDLLCYRHFLKQLPID